MEYGYFKDEIKAPVINYPIAYDANNSVPLFNEDYPVSLADFAQLQTMLEKANGYGYRHPLHDTIEYLNRIGVHGSEIKPQGMLVSAERCFRMTYLIATYLVLKYNDNEALLIQARSADKMGDISYNRFDLPDAERYTKIAVSLYMDLYQKTQWIGAREDVERCSKNLSRIQSEIKRIQDDVPQGIILGDVK